MFYRPLGGSAAAPREAWVPLQEVLLEARGLCGHTFEDITFEHSTSRQPSAPGGYVEIQSAVLQNAPCPPHGCEPRGAITVGADADFVVWDADATFRVPSPAAEKTAEWRGDAPAPTTAAALPPLATLHGALADGSTFEGATLRGVVRATYVRGRCVYAAAAPPPLASGAPEAIVGRFRSRPIGEAIGAPEWSERILETRPVVVQVDSSSCYDST